MNFPFKERLISEGVVERTFSSGADSDELIWHRDREDRRLLVVESGGWQFQMDNSLPVNLETGQELLVPAGAWHRVIRGNNDLKVIINKGQQAATEGFKMKLTKAALKQIIKEEITARNIQESRSAVATEFELYSEFLAITQQLQEFKDNLDFAMGLTADASRESELSDEVYETIRSAIRGLDDARIKMAQAIGQDPAPELAPVR